MSIPDTNTLIQISRDLEDLQRAFSQNLLPMSEGNLVALGSKLDNLVKSAENALGPIKDQLRILAFAVSNGEAGVASFQGVDGSQCTVSIPKPTNSIRKGVDMNGLKSLLGDDFDLFFETVVTYKPRDTLSQRIAKINPAKLPAVVAAVDQKEGTPRVYFKA